ncbi:MAG: serine/threonine protein kinase [Firmicutes bacterium]|nr:serine/threonine protein kinase [Bacillota bacterium]
MLCSNCGAQNKDTAMFCNTCGCDMSPTEFTGEAGSSSLEETPPTVRLRKGGPTLNRGRYEIIKEIASGGMGKIYLAMDNKTKTLVVVKKMLPVAETDEELEYLEKRFHEEGMLLYKLRHHALPQVLDFFTKGQNFYIIMEYIEGENLSQFIKRRPNSKITIEECIYFLDKVLDIIQFLHSQNPPVIHRDIKPGNIMINNLGEVVLVDFGLARSFDSESVGTARVGTYGFASPEHFSGKFKLSSDLYCAGVTFHFLLSGEDPRLRIPFEFPPLSKYRDDVPEGLQQVFNKLLAINPLDRYQTAQEVRKALEEFQDDQLRAFIEAPIEIEETKTPYSVTSIGEDSGRFDLRISEKQLQRSEQQIENRNGGNGSNGSNGSNGKKGNPPENAQSVQNTVSTPGTENKQASKTANGSGSISADKKQLQDKPSEIKPDQRAAIPIALTADAEVRKYDGKQDKKSGSKAKPDRKTKQEESKTKAKPEPAIKVKKKRFPAVLVTVILLIIAGSAFAAYNLPQSTIQKYLPFLYTKASESNKYGFITIDINKTNIRASLITVTSKDPDNFGQNGTMTYEGDSLLNAAAGASPASSVYIQVPPGTYTIKIAKKNFTDLVIKDQVIQTGISYNISQPMTELPKPVITVKTNVEASIYIGNEEKGKTTSPDLKFEMPVEAEVPFDIIAKKDGYAEAKAGPVSVEMGGKREFYLNLEQNVSGNSTAEATGSPSPSSLQTSAPVENPPSPAASPKTAPSPAPMPIN